MNLHLNDDLVEDKEDEKSPMQKLKDMMKNLPHLMKQAQRQVDAKKFGAKMDDIVDNYSVVMNF